MFEITTRPIPAKRKPKHLKYPFLKMCVGQGFTVSTFRELDAARKSAMTTIRSRVPNYRVGYRVVPEGFYIFRKPNKPARTS